MLCVSGSELFGVVPACEREAPNLGPRANHLLDRPQQGLPADA